MKHVLPIVLLALAFAACNAPKATKPRATTTNPTIAHPPKVDSATAGDAPKPATSDGETRHAQNAAPQLDAEETDGMTWTERKFFAKTTSMAAVYQETIRKGEIDDAELLLPQLPKNDKEVDVGANGLISVSYKVDAREVVVEMFYEGGVTTLSLRPQSGGVSRTITHSAD